MTLTIDLLKQLAPTAKDSILEGIVDYQEYMEDAEILPGNRRQMFLAQLAHESAGFRTTREYASGIAYEGREDLGNTEPGDGERYRGRGLIQLTGRANYRKYGEYLDMDFEADPTAVEKFPWALAVSVSYWDKKKLNDLADADDFRQITRRINGGLNGFDDRLRYLTKAKRLEL